MKKYLVIIIYSALTIGSTFATDLTSNKKMTNSAIKAEQEAKAKALVGRLHEIKTITEHAQLTIIQKRDLRKEVKQIKKDLQKLDGVSLYLSLTAILIIILLILLI